MRENHSRDPPATTVTSRHTAQLPASHWQKLHYSIAMQQSHTHTVVWECYKDDGKSWWGWEWQNLTPQRPKPLNRSSHEFAYVIMSRIRTVLLPCKILSRSYKGVSFPRMGNFVIHQICYSATFLGTSSHPQPKRPHRFWPSEPQNQNLKFWPHFLRALPFLGRFST